MFSNDSTTRSTRVLITGCAILRGPPSACREVNDKTERPDYEQPFVRSAPRTKMPREREDRYAESCHGDFLANEDWDGCNGGRSKVLGCSSRPPSSNAARSGAIPERLAVSLSRSR